MDSPRPPEDPDSQTFAERWLERHGLLFSDICLFESIENDVDVDLVLLNDDQLSAIPKGDRPPVISDLTGTRHLVYLRAPAAFSGGTSPTS